MAGGEKGGGCRRAWRLGIASCRVAPKRLAVLNACSSWVSFEPTMDTDEFGGCWASHLEIQQSFHMRIRLFQRIKLGGFQSRGSAHLDLREALGSSVDIPVGWRREGYKVLISGAGWVACLELLVGAMIWHEKISVQCLVSTWVRFLTGIPTSHHNANNKLE